MGVTKVCCATPPKKMLSEVGDPILGSAAIGIGGDYPVGVFAKDHQIPSNDEQQEASHAGSDKSPAD